MTTTSQNPHCVMKNKAVLVSIPDSEFSCRTRLFIAHDRTANEGSISIRFTAQLANLRGRSQVLTLIIPPEIVGNCELVWASDDDLCPYRLLTKLPAPETEPSAVSTLRLILNNTDLNFAAFAKICQSKSLLLHISQRQFGDEERGQLKAFLGALRKSNLREKLFGTKRQRMVRTTWRVFSPPDPPSYCDTLVSKQQVDPPRYEQSVPKQMIGKRGRDPWSPDERQRKLLLTSPPPGSPSPTPTEVNTPSVLSLSPASIRPTNFTHASSPDDLDHNGITRIAFELRGFSDDQIRELIIRSGRQHLLAMPEHTDLPSEFEKVGFANVEIIKQHVDKMIERRLKLHVIDIDKIVDRALSDFSHHEVDILEQVQAGNSEVNNTASECMEEMDKQAQKHVRDMKEQAQQHELDMEEKVEQRLCDIEIAEQRLSDMEKMAEQRLRDIEKQGFELENEFGKLKRWLNIPAQSLLDGQRGTEARRISI
ncbi:Intermediate filament protein [Penicillium digitatum]|nr:Intermediate filament protein [Penicillium digitatum]